MKNLFKIVLLSSVITTSASAQCIPEPVVHVVKPKVHRTFIQRMARRPVQHRTFLKKSIVCDKPVTDTLISMIQTETLSLIPVDSVMLYSALLPEFNFDTIDSTSNKKLWLWLIGAGAVGIIAWSIDWDNDASPPITPLPPIIPPIIPPTTPVPEPSTYVLMLLGFSGLYFYRKKYLLG